MTDEIQKAIDISNLSDEQIFELYNDVVEWGERDYDLLASWYCTTYCTVDGNNGYLAKNWTDTYAHSRYYRYIYYWNGTKKTVECYTHCTKN